MVVPRVAISIQMLNSQGSQTFKMADRRKTIPQNHVLGLRIELFDFVGEITIEVIEVQMPDIASHVQRLDEIETVLWNGGAEGDNGVGIAEVELVAAVQQANRLRISIFISKDLRAHSIAMLT